MFMIMVGAGQPEERTNSNRCRPNSHTIGDENL